MTHCAPNHRRSCGRRRHPSPRLPERRRIVEHQCRFVIAMLGGRGAVRQLRQESYRAPRNAASTRHASAAESPRPPRFGILSTGGRPIGRYATAHIGARVSGTPAFWTRAKSLSIVSKVGGAIAFSVGTPSGQDDSGCSCRVPGGAESTTIALVAALGVLARYRRRRRSSVRDSRRCYRRT
jgi:MYXO-CTERM domain-containing protein